MEKMTTTPPEKLARFKVPATEVDRRQLDANRARLWPSMLFCIIVVVAIIAACIAAFGWLPVLIALVIIAICGIALLVGFGSLHDATEEEKRAMKESLPGHDILAKEDIRATGGKSYDFDCAPSDIFPYFRQFNLIKAGYYSFDVLERFFGFHIVNDYTIRDEWQNLECGDWIYYHQNGAGTGIVDFSDNEYITTYTDTRYQTTTPLSVAWRPKWMKDFAWTWNFIFVPTNGGEGTHFITYLQAWWPEDTPKLTQMRLMIEWGLPSNFMMNGMARTIKRLAERDAAARRAGQPRPGYNYTK